MAPGTRGRPAGSSACATCSWAASAPHPAASPSAAQVVDSETDWQLWAERYDGALRGIFAVHDEITMRVVGGTEPHLYEEDELRGRAGA